MSTDLYEQKDGSYILADYDDEDTVPHKICISDENENNAITKNAARLVQIENGSVSNCAKFEVREIK